MYLKKLVEKLRRDRLGHVLGIASTRVANLALVLLQIARRDSNPLIDCTIVSDRGFTMYRACWRDRLLECQQRTPISQELQSGWLDGTFEPSGAEKKRKQRNASVPNSHSGAHQNQKHVSRNQK
jgi:hypothetical protein